MRKELVGVHDKFVNYIKRAEALEKEARELRAQAELYNRRASLISVGSYIWDKKKR